MILDELNNINSNNTEIKKFSKTIGITLLIISALLYYFESVNYIYFVGLGVLIYALGYSFPILLIPLHKVWMGLSIILGFFMSRLILTILFYFIITPIALVAKIFGKDFLELKMDESKSSYWNYRENKEYNKIDTERQF